MDIGLPINTTVTFKWLKRIGTLAAIIIGIVIINPFVIINAGERGVVLNWGAVSDTILNEGIHLRIPIQQKVVKLDVKNVKIETKVIAYSKDIQTVDSVVALNYYLNINSVNKLWQQIGENYQSRVIDPAIQESVKAATAKFTAQELIEERPKVKDEIKNQLSERLGGKHIIVDDFSIISFDFSDSYELAVEAKQVAQQSALKAENDLKRIKTEAEQRIAQAQAEAEAIRIQAQSISKQGGAEYVRLKTIEKWDGKLPTQMIPGSAVPFLELR